MLCLPLICLNFSSAKMAGFTIKTDDDRRFKVAGYLRHLEANPHCCLFIGILR